MEGRSLLISDLDGTLLGCDKSLQEFAAWHADQSDSLWLVYSSGRFISSIRESIATTDLPAPAAIIGGVGTEIYLEAEKRPLTAWQEQFSGWDVEALKTAVGIHKELELQPEEFQSPYKLSYYAYDLTPAFLQLMSDQLAKLGHRVRIVYSSDRDLDFLPEGVDKGSAATFIAQHWEIPTDRVFVSGDSANDSSMFEHGFRGIIVGNAAPELKALTEPSIYKSESHYAQGVLEGLKYWQSV